MTDFKITLKHPVNNIGVCIGPHQHTSEARIPKNFIQDFDPSLDVSPQDRVPWKCWSELLQENLDIEKIITYSEPNSSNISKIDKAIQLIVRQRPSYCFVVLDHWLQNNFNNDILIDHNSYDTQDNIFIEDFTKRTKKDITEKLESLYTDHPELITDNFLENTFTKLYSLILIAKEFDCALVVVQSIDPFYSLKTQYKQRNQNIYAAYSAIKQMLNEMTDVQKKLYEFYSIGFPFFQQNNYFFNIDNFDYFLPGCDNFLNPQGQQYLCIQFKNKALWQRSEDGINFLLK